MAAREPEVDRQQSEQRDDEHDPEVVGVAGQRIRPIDALPLDRSVDVDRARPAGQRREHGLVEVPPALGGDELQHAVGGVQRQPGGERADRLPVEALAAPREVRDRGDQEEDVDRPLEDPLAELAGAVAGVDRVVARQVDEQEREAEADDDGGRAREAPVAPRKPLERPHDEKRDREDVGQADRAGDVPVDLLEGDAEDRREEEEPRDLHATLRSRLASSSTRASRERRRRVSGSSGAPSSSPACQRA